MITDSEMKLISDAIARLGGELIEIVAGEKTVFKFSSTNKMLVLVDALKSDKRLSARLSVNSKRVDGDNILTIARK